ncbi:hypothetical protein NC652_010313 [Populus alba x Populus x berolinensis]|nr:hypothetical protein NC652_010313 [Populus alba x Populus x berolinensis]
MERIYFTLLLFYTILFMSSPAQYSLISLLNNGIDRPPYSLYCPYSLLVMYNNDVLLNNGFVLFHNSSLGISLFGNETKPSTWAKVHGGRRGGEIIPCKEASRCQWPRCACSIFKSFQCSNCQNEAFCLNLIV